MGDYLTDEMISDTVGNANAVVVASLKDMSLTRRVFRHIPDGAFSSFNPGSSDYKKQYLGELRDIMSEHPPTVLAVNDQEVSQLVGENIRDEKGEVDVDQARRLAGKATRYAPYVLCTLGASGMLLAYNGDVEYHPAPDVPPHLVKDTLGAGDRTHVIVADLLKRQTPEEDILPQVAQGVASVIQVRGAHADLYSSFNSNGQHSEWITS